MMLKYHPFNYYHADVKLLAVPYAVTSLLMMLNTSRTLLFRNILC